ncbi:MAG: type II CAAX endopeptidase family protein [Planctomycetota bacterium]|nr:type II CAAX endopeptidase family protein [Planctomycetota bacterium]
MRPPRDTERRAAKLWLQLRPALVLWTVLLGVNGVVALLASGSGTATGLTWQAAATLAMAVVTLAFVVRQPGLLRPLVRRVGITDDTWWFPFALLLGIWALMTGYTALVGLLGVEMLEYLEGFREAGWPLWSAFALISVAPAMIEEIAFRGIIQSRLEFVMRPRDALIVQAAMFSVLHMLPLVYISHFIMGLGFGVLRQKTGSIWPGVLVHMAWNAWVLVMEMAG